nr:ABC transporter ATP-binding protein [Lachnospiraceae bacterium]
ELLALVGLGTEKRQIKGFSRGMKQRLGIAQALLHSPKLLICDEPTSALDPVGRKEILDILLSAKEQTTVLFSTHILSDVERICTNAAFLDNGKIVMQGDMSAFKHIHSSKEFTVETENPQDAEKLLHRFHHAKRIEKNTLSFFEEEDLFFPVLQYITENRLPVLKIERTESSLETLFLEVTEK